MCNEGIRGTKRHFMKADEVHFCFIDTNELLDKQVIRGILLAE